MGNHQGLGYWCLDRAHFLKTNKSSYPLWYSPSPVKVRCNHNLQFKAVVVENGKILFWENLKENRSGNVPVNKNLVIEFEQSNPELRVQYETLSKKIESLNKLYVHKLEEMGVTYHNFYQEKPGTKVNFTIDVPKN